MENKDKETKIQIPKINFNFSYDLSKCNFEQDVLQNSMLDFYVRNDERFRKAMYTDLTSQFFQYIKDKVRLKEPIYISVMGQVRSSKSSSMITVVFIINYLNGRIMDMRYVNSNAIDLLDSIKNMPEGDLKNSAFLIDEEKTGTFGVGSVAKKLRMDDVQNIIAINNLSMISICPTKFPRASASHYGLRSFGRDFTNKINRFMLYNLQESDSTSRPMGMVYIRPFNYFLPEEYAKPLEKAYLEKKQNWVDNEMRSTGDLSTELKKRLAKIFSKDTIYSQIKKKNEKIAYLVSKVGNTEYTKSEIDELYNLISLYQQGFIQDDTS